MVKHIVMWQLKGFADGRSKDENLELVKEKLEKLKLAINEIITLDVGVNFNTGPAAFDIVLVTDFSNRQALQIYQDHPAHLEVKEFLQKVRIERTVVDYEYDAGT